MNNSFTCPYCNKRYRIDTPGNYICDCGVSFNYPETLSSTSRSHVAVEPMFIDSSSQSIQKGSVLNPCSYRKMSYISTQRCLDARISFLCGILGLLLFGISSIPAIFFGLRAKNKILNRRNKLTGTWMASTGLLTGIIGVVFWGVIFVIV